MNLLVSGHSMAEVNAKKIDSLQLVLLKISAQRAIHYCDWLLSLTKELPQQQQVSGTLESTTVCGLKA